jgi:hypothetical protein
MVAVAVLFHLRMLHFRAITGHSNYDSRLYSEVLRSTLVKPSIPRTFLALATILSTYETDFLSPHFFQHCLISNAQHLSCEWRSCLNGVLLDFLRLSFPTTGIIMKQKRKSFPRLSIDLETIDLETAAELIWRIGEDL